MEVNENTPRPDVEALLAERGWARRTALALARDAAAADDLEQQALLRALEHGEPVRSPRAWLGTVLRRLTVDLRRAEGRRRAREEAAARSEALASTAEAVARAEVLARATRAALELREPYRTVVVLRFFEGLSPAEIARRLDVPAETVKTRLRRALDLLRDRLDGDHRGDRRAWLLALLPGGARMAPASFLPGSASPVAEAGAWTGGDVASRAAELTWREVTAMGIRAVVATTAALALAAGAAWWLLPDGEVAPAAPVPAAAPTGGPLPGDTTPRTLPPVAEAAGGTAGAPAARTAAPTGKGVGVPPEDPLREFELGRLEPADGGAGAGGTVAGAGIRVERDTLRVDVAGASLVEFVPGDASEWVTLRAPGANESAEWEVEAHRLDLVRRAEAALGAGAAAGEGPPAGFSGRARAGGSQGVDGAATGADAADGSRIAGRVVDEAGNPVGSSFSVRLFPSGGTREGGPGVTMFSVAAGAGEFRSPVLRGDVAYDVVVGGVPGTIGGTLASVSPGPDPVTVTVRRGGTLRGRVVAAAGVEPRGPFLITAQTRDAGADLSRGGMGQVRTEADGTFLLEGLADHAFTVTATWGNLLSAEPVGPVRPGATVEVRVVCGHVLEGRIAPWPYGVRGGITLLATPRTSDGETPPPDVAQVAAAGRFRLVARRAGMHDLALVVPGLPTAIALGARDVPATDVEIALP